MDAEEVAFAVDVTEEPGEVRITPRGELDIATQGELRAVLGRHAGVATMVLDLGELRFIDTSGLRLVLETAEAARRNGRALAVLPGNAAVQRLFDVAGVAELVPFRDRGR
jgi:anti-anti-sigma factor